jgi:hypothetical protein
MQVFPSLLLVAALLCCSVLHSAVVVSGIRVHLVTHSHTDVGWLKTVDQYFTGVNRTNSFGNVHAILDSVLDGLLANRDRKFSYGEQAFFQRWYRTLSEKRRQQLRQVVSDGQLEFINGGWCMHDEATTYYLDMIDQTTLGHRYIRDQFGEQANPKAGWQIGRRLERRREAAAADAALPAAPLLTVRCLAVLRCLLLVRHVRSQLDPRRSADGRGGAERAAVRSHRLRGLQGAHGH